MKKPIPMLAFSLMAACDEEPDLPEDDTASQDSALEAMDSGEAPNTDIGTLCPAYSGLGAEGAWRTYATTPAYEASTGHSGGYRLEVARIAPDGTVVVRLDSALTARDGGKSTYIAHYTYICDKGGSALVHYALEGSYASAHLSYTYRQDSTYTDPYQTMIPAASTGDTWTDTWAYRYSYWSSVAGASEGAGEGTTTHTVGPERTVTGPAGPLTVRDFKGSTTVADHSSASTWAADRTQGLVLSEAYHLIASGD